MMLKENAVYILDKNRPLILLTEFISFLHDLGKLDHQCFEKHNERIRTEFGIDNENVDTIPKDEIPEIIQKLFTEASLSKSLENIVSKELLEFICNGKQTPNVGSPIFYHHYYKEKYKPRNNYEEIVAKSDNQDSEEDRGAQE
ncbi:MAG: hypothetical protein ACE5KE_05595, partial [Methanosarcinales archaeon]